MAIASLVLGALMCALLVVAFASSLPWQSAHAHHRTAPRPALLHSSRIPVALALVAGIAATLWLALESADAGGPVGQRPLLEQLLPLGVAVGLAGCLVMLPWRPEWVAAELHRLGCITPVVALAVLLVDAILTGSGMIALLGVSSAIWLGAGALLLVLARVLSEPGAGR